MSRPGAEGIFPWLGAAGTGYFLALGWGETARRRREFDVVTTFVTAIASVNYLAMALGPTTVTVPG